MPQIHVHELLHLRFLNTSDDMYADADITQVTEVKNGYQIKLTGEDSLNCEVYVWEYKRYVCLSLFISVIFVYIHMQ